MIRIFLLCALSWALIGFTHPACCSGSYMDGEDILDGPGREEVDLHGSVELKVRTEEGFADAGEDSSTTSRTDVAVDLGVAVRPSPWFEADFLLSWDDESPVRIDEAWLSLGNPALYPLNFSVGKMTLPFGLHESAMVSDPLTMEIGETKEEAVLLGLWWSGLRGAVYAYDGSSGRRREDEGLRSFGAHLGYLMGSEDRGLLVGADWISNIEDSDGLNEFIRDEGLILRDRIPGIAAFARLAMGPFTLAGEYVSALDRPEFIEEEEIERRDAPMAWMGEADMALEVLDMDLVIGATYGRTNGVGDLLPEHRFGVAVTLNPFAHFGLAIEYLREIDYPVRLEGTGDRADVITLQLASEF